MEHKSYYSRAKQTLVLLLEKIKNHSVLLEFYFLKAVGWIFFLFGFYSLFEPIIVDKPSSFSLIEILFQIKTDKGFRFWMPDEMREIVNFRVLISCFFPMIIGSILLLKNKPKKKRK